MAAAEKRNREASRVNSPSSPPTSGGSVQSRPSPPASSTSYVKSTSDRVPDSVPPSAGPGSTIDPKGRPYKPPAQKQRRLLKAYRVTFVVISSYLYFKFKRWIFGRGPESDMMALHKKNAKRIERALIELQGLFIKVGQLLSILANFLPKEFREEFEGLQDQVPARPFRDIERRIKRDLGRHPDEIFATFSRTPIASASLGQVHEAWTHEGQRVAVKVQHNDIEEIARLDLHAIKQIMRVVQWFVPVQGLDNYYREIRELILQELDFAREAQNIGRIRKNFAGHPEVAIPEVLANLSTSRVLTLSFVEGIKVGRIQELDALGIDRKELAKQIVHAFCQMIFVDGCYHADPHPGNLLVEKMPDGTMRVVLIDFGAVAELSLPMREGIPEFLEGVLRRDTDRLIKAMRKMGFLGIGSDEAMVEKVIDHFHKKFQDEVRIESLNLKDIKVDPQRGFENLLDLRKMNVGLKELSSNIHIPRDWVLLERTLVLLTGTCTQLDPDMNPMLVVRPYLEQFVLGNRDWTKIAIEAVRDTALRALSLPEDVHKYIQRAVRGELEVRVAGMREGFDVVYTVGRQLMYLTIAIVGGLTALYLHRQHDFRLARIIAWPAGIAAVLFLLSSVFSRPRRR